MVKIEAEPDYFPYDRMIITFDCETLEMQDLMLLTSRFGVFYHDSSWVRLTSDSARLVNVVFMDVDRKEYMRNIDLFNDRNVNQDGFEHILTFDEVADFQLIFDFERIPDSERTSSECLRDMELVRRWVLDFSEPLQVMTENILQLDYEEAIKDRKNIKASELKALPLYAYESLPALLNWVEEMYLLADNRQDITNHDEMHENINIEIWINFIYGRTKLSMNDLTEMASEFYNYYLSINQAYHMRP